MTDCRHAAAAHVPSPHAHVRFIMAQKAYHDAVNTGITGAAYTTYVHAERYCSAKWNTEAAVQASQCMSQMTLSSTSSATMGMGRSPGGCRWGFSPPSPVGLH